MPSSRHAAWQVEAVLFRNPQGIDAIAASQLGEHRCLGAANLHQSDAPKQGDQRPGVRQPHPDQCLSFDTAKRSGFKRKCKPSKHLYSDASLTSLLNGLREQWNVPTLKRNQNEVLGNEAGAKISAMQVAVYFKRFLFRHLVTIVCRAATL